MLDLILRSMRLAAVILIAAVALSPSAFVLGLVAQAWKVLFISGWNALL